MVLIYFLVALLSTICGSMAGLGGGVIIKPVLDFLGDYNIETIEFYQHVLFFLWP